jgi:hypothetical protein
MLYNEIGNLLINKDRDELKYLSEYFQINRYFIKKPNRKQKCILKILAKCGVLLEINEFKSDEYNGPKTIYFIVDCDFFKIYFPTII